MTRYFYLIGLSGTDESKVFGVAYNVLDKRAPICIWEGNPWENLGTCLSADDALQGIQVLKHFEIANANWFLPILHRMAGGENVRLEEIQALYFKCHGKPMHEGAATWDLIK